MDYPDGPNVITRVFPRGKQESQNQKEKISGYKQRSGRRKDVILLALKTEERDFPLEPPERTQVC